MSFIHQYVLFLNYTSFNGQASVRIWSYSLPTICIMHSLMLCLSPKAIAIGEPIGSDGSILPLEMNQPLYTKINAASSRLTQTYLESCLKHCLSLHLVGSMFLSTASLLRHALSLKITYCKDCLPLNRHNTSWLFFLFLNPYYHYVHMD